MTNDTCWGKPRTSDDSRYSMLRTRMLVAALVLSQFPLGAQNHPTATSKVDAKQIIRVRISSLTSFSTLKTLGTP